MFFVKILMTFFYAEGSIANKTAVVQVMAWHLINNKPFLQQYWPRCLKPYGVIMPHWFCTIIFGETLYIILTPGINAQHNIQCGADITWTILKKILAINTQQLSH